jgi:hypothetical protein
MSWVFRTYQRPSGRDDVRIWYKDLAGRDRATVLNTLQYLRDQPRDNWERPLGFAPLHGLNGMGEFLFKFGGVQNRLIGFFGPYRMSYTILLPVLKKGRSFDPREWEEIAARRKSEAESDSGCINVWLA